MNSLADRDRIVAEICEIDAMIARLGPRRVLEKDALAAQKKYLMNELAELDSSAMVDDIAARARWYLAMVAFVAITLPVHIKRKARDAKLRAEDWWRERKER